MSNANAFSGISQELIEKLSSDGITAPTKVQNMIIPKIQKGEKILFQSETGTGKTLAYLLPLIDRLEKDEDRTKLRILIIAPTFELASQINMTAKKLTSRKTALIIGGSPIKRQIETLKEKPQIITGTAARIVELARLKKIKLNDLTACVFDEIDRLVKKESFKETDEILHVIPSEIQLIACSATINKAARLFLPGITTEILPEEDVLKKNITHWAIYAESRDKIDTLRKFLAAEKIEKALVFTSRSDQVENIYSKLRYKKVDCMALYSKADKTERKMAIDRFRSGKSKILITSDLAARGLDIANISHVVQMDLPSDIDFFIHRSGRTARAGKSGINVVIGDEYEMRQFAAIEKKLGIIVYPKEIHDGKITEPVLD